MGLCDLKQPLGNGIRDHVFEFAGNFLRHGLIELKHRAAEVLHRQIAADDFLSNGAAFFSKADYRARTR